jgi:hypothetical protein
VEASAGTVLLLEGASLDLLEEGAALDLTGDGVRDRSPVTMLLYVRIGELVRLENEGPSSAAWPEAAVISGISCFGCGVLIFRVNHGFDFGGEAGRKFVVSLDLARRVCRLRSLDVDEAGTRCAPLLGGLLVIFW